MALTKIKSSNILDGTIASDDLGTGVGGSSRITDNSTGIDVTGNLVVSGTSPQIQIETGASHYNWQVAAQESVDGAFEISSGAVDGDATNDTYTPRLVIKANTGNVGIGCSPSAKLDVQSATGNTGFNYGTSTSPERGNLWYTTDGTGWKYNIGKVQSGSFTPQLTIQDNGNVGIGCSPSYQLHLDDTYPKIAFTASVGVARTVTVGVDNEDFKIHDITAGTDRVVINNAGNVLVSTGNVKVDTETKNFLTKIPYFSGGYGSSYSSTYSASQTSSTTTVAQGSYKVIGQVAARAYTNAICIKTNLTSDNIMFMFKAWGYLYGYGVAESYRGGYTYTGSVINKSGYKSGVAQADIQDVYRATDGSLCLRVYLGHTGYTEGKLNIAMHSHGTAYHSVKIVAVQIHNANTNYSF